VGPYLEKENNVTPFHVSLTTHEHMLHNCMLYFGSSHNLMPKAVMEKLGLDITREYKYMFSFDSRKVQCLGVIKGLVVNLTKMLNKSLVMEIIVEDVLSI
jgi:hypothetical protein